MPLIQALKHENNYDSVLARFLLYRSFRSPVIVGHTFFWTLKVYRNILQGELHTSFNSLYKILIQIYLECYPLHAEHLYEQNMLESLLENIARNAIKQPSSERTKYAKYK